MAQPTERRRGGAVAVRPGLLLVGLALLPLALLAVLLVLSGEASGGGLWAALAVAALAGAGLALALARGFSRRVLTPLARIRGVLQELSAGGLSARTGLGGDEDVAQVGQALDRFLDRRIESLQRAARDSEELNDSVIEIMQAVGQIASRKDLTIRVPVTENVTGAIADALNLLTEETRRLLLSVRSVSQDVARATVAVKAQSDTATRAAAREQREVEFAARELAAAAQALELIAERARSSNEAAARAVEAAGEAMRTVDGTVQGIAQSRALIRETEKRIKRLGERSQEVGQVVGIIGDIAERTGILALNASMQAAAAGPAGRSFAVVADEVKRLSESARAATVEIGELVGAIQTETGDTTVAMNQAIARIVQVSRLAEDAGGGMLRTREETDALAATVRDIARTSAEQAKVGVALQERARIIQEASSETARQLSLQAAETLRLVECAKALMREVSVYRVNER